MLRTGASRHVPEGRRERSPQRDKHLAWSDLVQPLSENDGSLRMVAGRSDRPDRVVGLERKVTMHDDFVFVDEHVSGVRWDAKYATWDNFTGQPVDGYLANRIVGSTALYSALKKARGGAAALGFGLLLWDGY